NGRRLRSDDFYSHLARVDHTFSQNHRLSVRVNANSLHEIANNNFDNVATGTNRYRVNRGASLDHVWVAGPSMVVNLRYGYTRWQERRPAISEGYDLNSLGFVSAWANSRSADVRTIPTVTVAGMSGLGGTWGYNEAYDTHTFAANASKTFGNHNLRFGGDLRVYKEARRDEGNAFGTWGFSTTWTRGPL